MKPINLISVKKITYFSYLVIIFCGFFIISSSYNLYKINSFNESISAGDTSSYFKQSFESRFSNCFFSEIKPATGMYQISKLISDDLLVEIEATAIFEN